MAIERASLLPLAAMKRAYPGYGRFLRRNAERVITDGIRRGLDEGHVRSVLERVERLATLRAEIDGFKGQKPKGKPAGSPDEIRMEIERRRTASAVIDREIASRQSQLAEIDTDGFLIDVFGLPNILDPSTPVGGEVDARVINVWDQRIQRGAYRPRWAKSFNPRPHEKVAQALGIVDFDVAAQLAGSRFVMFRGPGVELQQALIQFMLDLHRDQRSDDRQGYELISPPFVVRPEAMFGTGNLPKFLESLYADPLAGLLLVPTAEVPLTNIPADRTLVPEKLPLRFTAYTPCFRTEAGAAGKDTKGMIRVHQFDKVELVAITRPDQSMTELEKLTRDAEEVLEILGLPYRRVQLADHDIGSASMKTYDLEVWLPGQDAPDGASGPGRYREISSCSNCGPYQAARANIRVEGITGEDGTNFAHTLNGSGVAVGRAMVAVLENGQESDGSVVIPEVLRAYMGTTDRILPPEKRSRHFYVAPHQRPRLEQQVQSAIDGRLVGEDELTRVVLPYLHVMPLRHMRLHEMTIPEEVDHVWDSMRRKRQFTAPVIAGAPRVWDIPVLRGIPFVDRLPVTETRAATIDGNHRVSALIREGFDYVVALAFPYKDQRVQLGFWMRKIEISKTGKSRLQIKNILKEHRFEKVDDVSGFLASPRRDVLHVMVDNELYVFNPDGSKDGSLKGTKGRLESYRVMANLDAIFGIVSKNDFFVDDEAGAHDPVPGVIKMFPTHLTKSDVLAFDVQDHVFGKDVVKSGNSLVKVGVLPKKSTRHVMPFRIFGLPFPLDLLSRTRKTWGTAVNLTDFVRRQLAGERVVKITPEESGALYDLGGVANVFDRRPYLEPIYWVVPPLRTLTREELYKLNKVFGGPEV